MQNKHWLFVVCGSVPLRTLDFVRSKAVTDLHVPSSVPKLRQKIFDWLRNITNSAGIRLATKKIRLQRGAGWQNSARQHSAAAQGSR